jgi:hypothetical protein
MFDQKLIHPIVRGKNPDRVSIERIRNVVSTRGHRSPVPAFARLALTMPLLPEALRFAQNPATSIEQLRRACELLSLDTSGTQDELRARLLAHLHTLDSEMPVVCLNPKVQA